MSALTTQPILVREEHQLLSQNLESERNKNPVRQVANRLFDAAKQGELSSIKRALETLKVMKVNDLKLNNILLNSLRVAVEEDKQEAIISLLKIPSIKIKLKELVHIYKRCSDETRAQLPENIKNEIESTFVKLNRSKCFVGPMSMASVAAAIGVAPGVLKIAAVAALIILFKIVIVIAIVVAISLITYLICQVVMKRMENKSIPEHLEMRHIPDRMITT